MWATVRAATIGMVACLYITSCLSQQMAPSAVGLWERTDSSGRAEAWFRIYQCEGRYQGQIVRIFPQSGGDPSTWRCTKCDGDQKGSPVVGLVLIKGMERKGLRYEGGTILDPRDGSVYRALMELSPDGERLEVRGYLVIPLLGRSETWRRIGDSGDYHLPPTPPCSSRGIESRGSMSLAQARRAVCGKCSQTSR
jgi:uncharacterized protein (DUF2147 family)